MIIYAIDVATGERVHIKNAIKARAYKCEHCDVSVNPVQGDIKDWFYRCGNDHHRRSICAQMTHYSNRIYNADQIDPETFFDVLFRGDRTNGPIDPPVPPVFPPVDPPYRGGDPDAVEIVPCRTLSQLWAAKVAELPHDMPIGNGRLSDVFVAQKNFWRYLDNDEPLDNRVLELKPIMYFDRASVIVFLASWGKKMKDGFENRAKLFLLRFADRELFKETIFKLFKMKQNADGTSRRGCSFDAVLVAGCWHECREEEYRGFGVKPKENCVGVQIADCSSGKQLYTIPEKRSKN